MTAGLPLLAGLLTAVAVLLAFHDGLPRRSDRRRSDPRRSAHVRRGRGRPVTHPPLRRPRHRSGRRRDVGAMVLMAALALALTVIVGPIPLLALLGLTVVVATRMAHGRRVRRRRAVDDTAVDLIDLFGVALASGQPVPSAVLTVAERAPGPVREPMRRAAHRLRHGMSVETVLDDLHELGAAHRPLVEVLRTAHLDGTPVLAALDRIAETARDHRRRGTEARVRRLPVTMLFPLVVCILPAFGILTVVPLLIVSLTDLS